MVDRERPFIAKGRRKFLMVYVPWANKGVGINRFHLAFFTGLMILMASIIGITGYNAFSRHRAYIFMPQEQVVSMVIPWVSAVVVLALGGGIVLWVFLNNRFMGLIMAVHRCTRQRTYEGRRCQIEPRADDLQLKVIEQINLCFDASDRENALLGQRQTILQQRIDQLVRKSQESHRDAEHYWGCLLRELVDTHQAQLLSLNAKEVQEIINKAHRSKQAKGAGVEGKDEEA